jgi:hypothetical protein
LSLIKKSGDLTKMSTVAAPMEITSSMRSLGGIGKLD